MKGVGESGYGKETTSPLPPRVRLLRYCGSVCAWSRTAVIDPQRTYRAMARAHEAYTFFATNTTDSQPPIGREPVGTDSVRYRRPDRPRLGQPLF